MLCNPRDGLQLLIKCSREGMKNGTNAGSAGGDVVGTSPVTRETNSGKRMVQEELQKPPIWVCFHHLEYNSIEQPLHVRITPTVPRQGPIAELQ